MSELVAITQLSHRGAAMANQLRTLRDGYPSVREHRDERVTQFARGLLGIDARDGGEGPPEVAPDIGSVQLRPVCRGEHKPGLLPGRSGQSLLQGCSLSDVVPNSTASTCAHVKAFDSAQPASGYVSKLDHVPSHQVPGPLAARTDRFRYPYCGSERRTRASRGALTRCNTGFRLSRRSIPLAVEVAVWKVST